MQGMFNHRLRGFRTINVIFLAILLVLAVGVNLGKTYAGRERRQIVSVERKIADENRRIRLLQAEVAHLETPERLERLSRQMGMEPVAGKREGVTEQLPAIAAGRNP